MSEKDLNARKKMVDGLASALLDIDQDKIKKMAQDVDDELMKHDLPLRIAVCGGAGSNKTTFANELSEILGVPSYDIDEFIPKGYTPDKEEYSKRLDTGWKKLYETMPVSGQWIIEHIDACHPDTLKMFKPTVGVLLNPGVDQLKAVADARNMVGHEEGKDRRRRALESGISARSQFDAAPGKVVLRRPTFEVKILET